MELRDQLTIERYRFVQTRAAYFADLARDYFSTYLRYFVLLSVLLFTLVALRKSLALPESLWLMICVGIGTVQTLLGVSAFVQIIFCTGRYEGFRAAETAINQDAPSKHHSGMFNFFLVAGIVLTLMFTWSFLYLLVQAISKAG